MFSFLKKIFTPKVILQTALSVALLKTKEKLDAKDLGEVERAVVDAVLTDFVEDINEARGIVRDSSLRHLVRSPMYLSSTRTTTTQLTK